MSHVSIAQPLERGMKQHGLSHQLLSCKYEGIFLTLMWFKRRMYAGCIVQQTANARDCHQAAASVVHHGSVADCPCSSQCQKRSRMAHSAINSESLCPYEVTVAPAYASTPADGSVLINRTADREG